MENKELQQTASLGGGGNSTSDPSGLKRSRLRRLFLRVGLPLLLLLLIAGVLLWLGVFQSRVEDQGRLAHQFENIELPLNELIDGDGVAFDGARSLVVNGTLKANEGVIVTPSALPSAPTEGQIYYDQTRDEIGYYNGSQFVYLGEAEAGVTSFSGATGAITIGEGLSFAGGTLSAVPTTETADGDASIGNEITNVITSAGLVRVGSGTTVDPFRVGLITCANGQIIKSGGAGTWNCAEDSGTTYTAGSGITFNGTEIYNSGVLSFAIPAGSGLANVGNAQNVSLKLQDCANNQLLQYTTSSGWQCVTAGGVTPYSFTISDGTTAQAIDDGNTVTFIGNEGLSAAVSATDTITYGIASSGVTTVKLANGAVTSTKLADGTVLTAKLEDGAVTNIKLGNNAVNSAKIQDGSIANADLANNSLTVSAGNGLSGGGAVALGSSTVLQLQPCANDEILKYNAGSWDCAADNGGDGTGTDDQTLSISAGAANGQNTITYDLTIEDGNTVQFDDRDTLYTALAGGGLSLNGQAFSLQTCAVGQVLKSTNASSPGWDCAADGNTTYTAGTGISFSGTQINNAGVLGIAAANSGGNSNTPILLGGTTQNPTVGFANGSVAGQFWQWNGSEWELSTPVGGDGDGVVGNEVTGVTGSMSGLTRSGTGTSVSPYTLAVNVGTGLAINGSNQITNTGVLSFATGASTALTNSGGQNPLVDLKPCDDGEVLRYETAGSTWECVGLAGATAQTFDITDGSTVQTIGDNEVITFVGNQGLVAAVSATNTVTYGIANSGVTSIKIADGSIVSSKIDDDAVVTAKLDDGAVTNVKLAANAVNGGNIVNGSVDNADLANNSLTVSAGNGLTGGGVVALGASTTLSLQACANGEILKYNGGAWNCDTDTGGDGTGTDDQLLTIDASAADGQNTITYDLTIEDGNTVQFDDRDTLYTAATGGGLALNGQAFSLQTCTNSQILKFNSTSSNWECAADGEGSDNDTTYTAGTGLSLTGNTFNLNVGMGLDVDGNNDLVNNGVLSVGGSGAIASSGGQNPDISLDTSANFTQTGDSLDLSDSGASSGTYGNTGVSVAQLTVDAKGRITAVSNRTLPTASASVTGVLSSTDFASFTAKENALTFSAPLSRSGNTISLNLTSTGITSTTASASGLEVAGSGLSMLRGCTNTQLLKWNTSGQAWACANDVDTDTNTTYNAGEGLTLGGTTFSIDLTGATTGQVLTFDGTGVAWQNPTAPSCATGSGGTYFCQGGNSFGGTATLGTNDAFALAFETGGTTKMTILSGGNMGIGETNPSAILHVSGTGTSLFKVTDSTVTAVDVLNIADEGAVIFRNRTNSTSAFRVQTANGTNNVFTVDTTNVLVRLSTTGGWDADLNSATGAIQIGPDNGANMAFDANEIIARNNNGTATLFVQNNGGGFTVGATAVRFQNTADTADAFQILNASGSSTIFDVDTNTGSVGIGTTNSSTGLTVSRSLFGVGNNANYNVLSLDTAAAAQGVGGGIGFGGNADSARVFAVIQGFHESSTASNNAGGLRFFTRTNGNDILNEQMRISSSGNIGIGTTDPVAALHLARGNDNNRLQLTNTSTGHTATDGLFMGLDPSGGSYFFSFEDRTMYFGNNGQAQLRIASASGNVGIQQASPSTYLHVGSTDIASGTAVARFQNAVASCFVTPTTSGGYSCSSDERLKKNIETFSGAVDIISQIDVKRYNMRSEADGTLKQVGVMAQQLERVLPGLVTTDSDGYKTVSYAGLAPVLLAAVQEQQVQLNQLKRSAWAGGLVSKSTRFASSVIFDGPVTYKGKADFKGDVSIAGKLRLSGDQVNEAVLPAGSTQVQVAFGGRYLAQPYVTATPREFLDGQYRITDVSATGFTIETTTPAAKEVRFDWHAFMK